jgi:hypothetical protein
MKIIKKHFELKIFNWNDMDFILFHVRVFSFQTAVVFEYQKKKSGFRKEWCGLYFAIGVCGHDIIIAIS